MIQLRHQAWCTTLSLPLIYHLFERTHCFLKRVCNDAQRAKLVAATKQACLTAARTAGSLGLVAFRSVFRLFLITGDSLVGARGGLWTDRAGESVWKKRTKNSHETLQEAMSKEPGYKTYDSVLTVEGMLRKTPPAELLQLLQALDSAKALSKVGLNASDLHFDLVEELEHLLCKDLKDQFSAQALEFMLCNAKATYTFDMLIPRVCSELYRQVGESHEALRVEFKHLTGNIVTFIYGVMGAVRRFSGANLTSSPYRNKIRGIWRMMLDCVHDLRNHLPTTGDLSSLIGAPPTDLALKRRQDTLKDHVNLFAVWQIGLQLMWGLATLSSIAEPSG